MTDFDYLRKHTPSKWSLVERDRGGPWDGPGRAVWEYNPRPRLTVRVVPHPDWETGVPYYCVQIENGIQSSQYTVPSTGFLPHVDAAERLMRGIDGVTAEQVRIRLGIHATAAGALADRLRTWEDLANLVDEWQGDLTRIDGVGAATNDTITTAADVGVFDQDPVEAARNPDESDDEKHAVYVLVPALYDAENEPSRGWRVRKEWRDAADDSLLASVILPTENPVGDLHATREAAEEFAQAAAAERRGEEPDGPSTSTTEDAGQASISRWTT